MRAFLLSLSSFISRALHTSPKGYWHAMAVTASPEGYKLVHYGISKLLDGLGDRIIDSTFSATHLSHCPAYLFALVLPALPRVTSLHLNIGPSLSFPRFLTLLPPGLTVLDASAGVAVLEPLLIGLADETVFSNLAGVPKLQQHRMGWYDIGRGRGTGIMSEELVNAAIAGSKRRETVKDLGSGKDVFAHLTQGDETEVGALDVNQFVIDGPIDGANWPTDGFNVVRYLGMLQ